MCKLNENTQMWEIVKQNAKIYQRVCDLDAETSILSWPSISCRERKSFLILN